MRESTRVHALGECPEAVLPSPNMSTTNREVCPNPHHEPHPHVEAHCPPWCVQAHDDEIWPDCCDGVVHTLPLEVVPFDPDLSQSVVIRLEAFESTAQGVEPASLSIENNPNDFCGLTPAQVDAFAESLSRGAAKARQMIAAEG